MEEGRRNVVYKEVDWRVGKLSFLEKLRLPQSFTFSAVSGVVFSTPLFLLWHRRLGHVSSPRLISTGMLGSVPNIEISTCMGCNKLGKGSALPLLKTLFLLLFLILCPKLLCYRKEAVYVIFDRRML